MNKKSYRSILVAICAIMPSSLSAATFSLTAGSFAEMQDDGGTALVDGSIVQIGYFNGVSTATDPGSYTLADWAAFTPISGIDSFNPIKASAISSTLGIGTFDLGISYDTTSDVLPGTNGGPGSYSARIGIRIFDSTTTTSGSNYNTVAGYNATPSLDTWLLNDPDVDPFTPPNIFIATLMDAGLAWESGGANAGKTSLLFATVPEPSALGLLGLGLGTMLLRRKRS